ncbi:hypothetical protein MOQ_010135, partial [Trypanosoma cruzi marinkellei]
VGQDGPTGIYGRRIARGIRPRCGEHWDRPRHPTEGCRLGRTPEESFAIGEEDAPDAPTGNEVISPNDTAGAPREAAKKSDIPCNDDVAADGVTSVVGQPAGDEAASDSVGGGATTAGPKGSDAADAAQCVVYPPRSDAEAAVGRGDCEADMTDAPPLIHGNNATAAVPVRRRGTTVLGAAWTPLRGEATAVASCVARTQQWM